MVHLLGVVLHMLYLHFMALFDQLVDLLQLFQIDFFHLGSLYDFLQSFPIQFLALRIFALFILLEHRLVFAFKFMFLSICIMNRVNTVHRSLVGNFTFIHVLKPQSCLLAVKLFLFLLKNFLSDVETIAN